MHPPAHHHLETATLRKLRPTQLTVSLSEVRAKRAQWAALKPRRRLEVLHSHWFPAVLGPDGRHHIVDHHHLGLALLSEGVDEVRLLLLDDLSYLDVESFWSIMEHRRWLHPFDAEGRRQPPERIPKQLQALVDDPCRGLAARVRDSGGFAKDAEPFAEFLWADFLRRRMAPADVALALAQPGNGGASGGDAAAHALRAAVALARSPQARFLPGWTGSAPG